MTAQKKRMAAGLAYLPTDPAILGPQLKLIAALDAYNRTRATDQKKRAALLRRLFGRIGADCYFEPPLHANFGCRHVFCGDRVYANFNLVLVDDGSIFIGDGVLFGPNVTVVTAAHPVEPSLRRKGYQFNRDVHLGANVWIGAGAVILPGVTVGADSVIGAGSVVTRDVPAGVVACGVPCRTLRKIGPRDHERLYDGRGIDWPALRAAEAPRPARKGKRR